MSLDRGNPAPPEGRSPTTHELIEHLTFVRSVAIAVVGDPDLAEDLSQEAILAAIQRPPTIERDLKSWLGGVVRNLARVHYRERARRRRRETMVAETNAVAAQSRDTVEEAMGRAELRQQIAQAVLELEDPYRTILILRYMENLTPTEIAKVTERPISTVKTQLSRGLDRLRHRFDDRAGGRDRWRPAFLGLLLPLPVLLANASVASAASAVAWSNAGSSTTTIGEGAGALVKGKGALVGGASGSAAGTGIGLLTWAPVVAVLTVATWWALPDPEPEPAVTPIAEESADRSDRSLGADDLTPLTDAQRDSNRGDRKEEANDALLGTSPIRVVDEAGEPIAGATIRPTTPFPSDGQEASLPSSFSPVETDLAGRASLPSGFRGLLRVSHPDYLSQIFDTEAGSNPGTEEAALAASPDDEDRWRVTLSAGVLATLIVTDRDGDPIEGAEVSWKQFFPALSDAIDRTVRGSPDEEISRLASGDQFDWTVHNLSKWIMGPKQTDAAGRIQIRVSEGSTILDVSAAGFAPIDWHSYQLSGDEPLLLRLSREARLRLLRRESITTDEIFQLFFRGTLRQVTFPAGETIAEFSELPSGFALLRSSPLAGVRIDEEGTTEALAEGTANSTGSELTDFEIAGDLGSDFEAILTQSPLVGETTELVDPALPTWLMDAFTAQVELTEEGSSSIHFVSLHPKGSGAVARPIELIEGEQVDVWIDLPPTGTITVDVDPPLEPGARVLSLCTPEGLPVAQATRTEDGFRFEQVSPGPYLLLLLDDWKPIAQATIEVDEGETSHTFHLPRGELQMSGLPPGARVLFERESTAPPPLTGMPLLAAPPAVGERVEGEADENGAFQRGNLPLGPATVWWLDGGELRRQRIELTDPPTPVTAKARAGEKVVLSLVGTPRSQRYLRVTPARSSVAPGIFRSIVDPVQVAQFDAVGRAYVELNLPAGDYRVVLWSETYFAEVHTLRVPVSGVQNLSSPAEERVSIRGRHAGMPLAHAMINVAALGPSVEGSEVFRLDHEGRLELPLPIGRYLIHFEDVTHEIEVGEGPRRFELSF